MPNIKSSKKSVKTDRVQTAANNEYTARVKNSIKKCEKKLLRIMILKLLIKNLKTL